MQVLDCSFPEVKRISPKIFSDDRGFFRETFRKTSYLEAGISCEFVQDNHSYSKRGTIRGMHFQRFPGQAKLVTVVSGKIFDVFVDIRPNSPTFRKWEGVYVDPEVQLFIPVGFAHGFCVVSDEAHVIYKVSTVYDPIEEKSFRYDDPEVGIEWPCSEPTLSPRDLSSPFLREAIL